MRKEKEMYAAIHSDAQTLYDKAMEKKRAFGLTIGEEIALAFLGVKLAASVDYCAKKNISL